MRGGIDLRGTAGTISGIGKVLYLDCDGVYISVYTFVKIHWTIKWTYLLNVNYISIKLFIININLGAFHHI